MQVLQDEMLANTTASASPVARSNYAMSVFENDILVCCGRGIDQDFNDLWRLNLKTMKWTELIPNDQIGSPSKRYIGGDLVRIGLFDFLIFGGCSSTGVYLNDLWRLHHETISLYELQVSPNPVEYDRPFNFSWGVNSQYGSSNHIATILFQGQNHTAQFPNVPGGWMMLNIINASAANISLGLFVADPNYSFVTLKKTINFTRI
jgi:hypothetical protein